MSNSQVAAALRPHTPSAVLRAGAVRPGTGQPRRRARNQGPARAAPSTAKVRVRRPRSMVCKVVNPPKAEVALVAQPATRAPSLADQLGQKVYVAELQGPAGDLSIEPNKTCFFDTINQVKALTVAGQSSLCIDEDLAAARGYCPEDLMAVAEIAWHYLMSGGHKLARTLYEGLTAVAPEEPYFALALGLTFDRLDDPKQADAWYRRASKLDPKDGRPDINRAELCLEAGDRAQAIKLLKRGATKAARAGDNVLAIKADALVEHLSR